MKGGVRRIECRLGNPGSSSALENEVYVGERVEAVGRREAGEERRWIQKGRCEDFAELAVRSLRLVLRGVGRGMVCG
jgi:hypothetical protein